jgi:hypothetical protein
MPSAHDNIDKKVSAEDTKTAGYRSICLDIYNLQNDNVKFNFTHYKIHDYK